MAIHFRLSKRKNPLNTNEVQHIIQAVSTGTIDLETIAYEISNENTLSEVDVHAVLRALGKKIQYHLNEGKIVDLDHIGKFKVGIKCKSSSDPALLSKKSIEKFSLNFQPSIKMKYWLKKEVEAVKEGTITKFKQLRG